MTNTTQPETQTRTSIISTLITIFTRARSSHKSQSQHPVTDHSDALDLLANNRRRAIIEILADTDDTVTLSDLSEHVAAKENNCSRQEVTATQRDRAYIAAYQSHLPKLDRLGYVHINTDSGTVTPTDRLVRLWDAYRSFCAALDG